MSCRFCEDRKPVKSYGIGPGIRTMFMNMNLLFGRNEEYDDKEIDCIFLNEDGMLGFDSSSGEYAAQFIKIAFCPFCGKEIRGGDAK